MTTPRVPAFQNRIEPAKADAKGTVAAEGSRVDVNVGRYLPQIYGDQKQNNNGNTGSGGGGDNKGLVEFFAGANTGQLKALAGRVTQPQSRPMYPAGSVLSLVGPNARPAAFSRMSTAEYNRREWGDFRPGGTTRAKYSPLDGVPITFDPNDKPISATVSREKLAASTTVDGNWDSQVRGGVYEAHLNRGNPRKDRLQVYELAGTRLRA